HRRRAEPGAALHDRVEYGLHVGLRVRDGTQDLTRRRLLIQRLGHLGMRLGQRLILLLQLGEQPHILDRNDSLVSEGLEELDLFVRERINFGASELNRSDRRLLAQQRNAQRRPGPQPFREGAPFRERLRLGLEVSHVNIPALENGASSDGSSHARDWDAEVDWNRAVVGGRPQVFAVESEDDRVVGSAEARRTLDDDLQDWLELRRRGGDNPQDLGGRRLLLVRLRERYTKFFGFLCGRRVLHRALQRRNALAESF